MTVEKLERVLWRLRKHKPGEDRFKNTELRRAIMHEIGTDPRTYNTTRKALISIGWIKSRGRTLIELTGKDITGDEI